MDPRGSEQLERGRLKAPEEGLETSESTDGGTLVASALTEETTETDERRERASKRPSSVADGREGVGIAATSTGSSRGRPETSGIPVGGESMEMSGEWLERVD